MLRFPQPESLHLSTAAPTARRSFSRPALVLAAYWLLLFVGSHTPEAAPPPIGISIDKLVHLVAFTGLAWLMAAVAHHRENRFTIRAATMIFVIAILYGAMDELTQPYVGRSCDLLDWVADALGAVLGITAFAVWNWLNAEGGLRKAD